MTEARNILKGSNPPTFVRKIQPCDAILPSREKWLQYILPVACERDAYNIVLTGNISPYLYAERRKEITE